MEKKPKSKDEVLFAHGFGIRIALQGVIFSTLSGSTGFNMRSEHSLFKIREKNAPQSFTLQCIFMDLRGVDTLNILPEALYYAACRSFVFSVPRFYPSFFILRLISITIEFYPKRSILSLAFIQIPFYAF